MSSEKMREEFDVWFRGITKDWPEPSDAIRKVSGDLYWECWQASRASVVVELPYPGTDYDYSDSQVNGACKHHGKAVRVIKSLGLKVSE